MAAAKNGNGKVSQGTRRVLVRAYKSTFVVTVPDGAKLTIGPDLPYGPKQNRFEAPQENRTYAFRAYQGDKLLMYLPRVEWMRDLDGTDIARLDLQEKWKEPDKSGMEALISTAGAKIMFSPSPPGEDMKVPPEEMV